MTDERGCSCITLHATLMVSMIFDKKEFVLVDRSDDGLHNKEQNTPHRKPGQYEVLTEKFL